MSKSRFNVINPDDVIDEYGADTLRLYELFIGPLSVSAPWQMAGVDGVYRFLERVWRLVVNEDTGELNEKLTGAPPESAMNLWKLLHKTIKGVTEDTETIDKMNTAISYMMVFVNGAMQAKTLPKETIKLFLRLLNPYAPHIAEELWQRLGEPELIAYAEWPKYDEALCVDETITMPVQINGKVRTCLEVPPDIANDELKKLALADERVRRYTDGKNITKVIVVPGRLVSVVVK